eukprot:2399029-Amphidinium_carterae.1
MLCAPNLRLFNGPNPHWEEPAPEVQSAVASAGQDEATEVPAQQIAQCVKTPSPNPGLLHTLGTANSR